VARAEKVEGVVILGARTDEEGNVQSAVVYMSKTPLLNQAAIDAVKQWKYEPLYIDGKAVPMVFTITVKFMLNGGKPAQPEEGVVRLGETKKSPKLITRVNPKYPAEAKKAGIQGVVVLEALVDEHGRVTGVDILKSESSVLNKPAIDAVKQWVYEPYILDGKPTKVRFTVTVRFQLR
jgi:TonB family protein